VHLPRGTRLNSLQELLERWNVPNPEQWLATAAHDGPFWASLLLVIGIGYEAARLVWLAVPGPVLPPWTPPPRLATSQATGIQAAGDYSAVVSAHLFGRATASAPTGANGKVDAPETSLSLQLKGAIPSTNEKFAHAIIGDGTGTEKVYFLRDTVPGGAILQSIEADRVILDRGGSLEALVLPRDSGAAGAQRQAAAMAPPKPPGTPAPSIQEAVTQNAGNLMQIIRPQPYMPNGEMKGYRVYPGRNREQFVALGLQPGDLVTQINGTGLNNPNQAMELFRALGQTTQAQVQIERDGKTQTLTLDTTQVASAGGETPK
jgi:general secretion pathway protein C